MSSDNLDQVPSKPARRRVTRPAGGAAAQATPFATEPPPPDQPAPADDNVVPTEVTPTDVPATAEPLAPTAKRATAKRSASRRPTAEPVEDQPADSSPAVEPPAPAKRRSAARQSAAASTLEPVFSVNLDDLGLIADSAVTEPTAEPVAKTPSKPVTAPPRLATTAVLFQAPDLTPRRPRRAVAPAGSPAERLHFAELPDLTPAPTEPPAKDVQPETEPSRDTVNDFVPRELTADEAAAAAEVGLIEDELRAEGIRLTRLNRADVAEFVRSLEVDADERSEEHGDHDHDDDHLDEHDDDDHDDDRPRRRRRRGGRGRRPGTRLPEHDDDSHDDSHDEHDDAARGRRRRADFGEGKEGVDERSEEHTDHDSHGDDADVTGDAEEPHDEQSEEHDESGSASRRRRRRGSRTERAERVSPIRSEEPTALKGSTRLEAKRQRRRDGRDAGRRRQIITEAEFLARRESVERTMVVREHNSRTQIAVLEDGVLVEHYVSQQSGASMVGNVYLGRIQNVLPSMEAAFVDVGKGRNAVLYAGEVNWDAAGIEVSQPRKIEEALHSGDTVLVQVTKDPIGHKGARLTSQITLAGRYLVLVPGGAMTGISRKLPEPERNRLKKILREVVPADSGVIVRTAAEGASEDELRADVERLQKQWDAIEKKTSRKAVSAPQLLQGEPDLAIRVVRDIFNDDFAKLLVQGESAWREVSTYIEELAPDLRERATKWNDAADVFSVYRVDEQLAKGMDRKVWLPSGGSLVIDRTEAMTVIDVNTGKFTGSGGTLEETVTKNNLEAAEEIVRQLRLRDIGGIIVVDFIDMVLESNRDLVLRRLVECLSRDRTKHQVAEVTSLGLVQMTRKRVGQGLVEAFSETCDHCKGRGFIVHTDPNEPAGSVEPPVETVEPRRNRHSRRPAVPEIEVPVLPEEHSEAREAVKATLNAIAAAAVQAHESHDAHHDAHHDTHAAPESEAQPPIEPTTLTVPTTPTKRSGSRRVVRPATKPDDA